MLNGGSAQLCDCNTASLRLVRTSIAPKVTLVGQIANARSELYRALDAACGERAAEACERGAQDALVSLAWRVSEVCYVPEGYLCV